MDPRDMHELRIESIRLVGGGREIEFNRGFSVVTGSITSGKTTLVRLIRAMLGRVPGHLPPETGVIRSIQGRLQLGSETWVIERPLVSTETTYVNLSRREDRRGDSAVLRDDPTSDAILDTLRLPAVSATALEARTYQSWLLEKLGLPEVSVPRARTDPASPPTPVTINDWLTYCIVRDEELDTSVFGHKDPFVDRKRRAVFELIYGIYDEAVARLEAELRSTELRLEDVERTTEAVRGFLQGTPLSGLDDIDSQLEAAHTSLATIDQQAEQLAQEAHQESASSVLRNQIADAEAKLHEQEGLLRASEKNIGDLKDLHSGLTAQSGRLTRAIVAEEWLVDFDFIVCPRCGTGVEAERSTVDDCYLCLQEPHRIDVHEGLIKEQQRIAAQIVETEELIENRKEEVAELKHRVGNMHSELLELHDELNRRTANFVSVRSDTLASHARDRARLQTEVQRLNEYRDLFVRFNDFDGLRRELEERRIDLADTLAAQAMTSERSEHLIRSLESRFLEYLERLHVSLSDLPITASIDRRTFMPKVAERPFDELSSQGLTVLVNVAHALAHHTVCIDHDLPLPGLLILDGLSNNVGHEGFDLARRDDTYRLLMEETERYEDLLQVIALDNDVPSFSAEAIVLTLTTSDRLIHARVDESVQ